MSWIHEAAALGGAIAASSVAVMLVQFIGGVVTTPDRWLRTADTFERLLSDERALNRRSSVISRPYVRLSASIGGCLILWFVFGLPANQ